jgi:hypothetical protein
MLAAPGASPAEDRVYGVLVTAVSACEDEIADGTALSQDEVRAADRREAEEQGGAAERRQTCSHREPWRLRSLLLLEQRRPPERRELRANLTGPREKGWLFHEIDVNSPLAEEIRRRLVSVLRLPPGRPPGSSGSPGLLAAGRGPARARPFRFWWRSVLGSSPYAVTETPAAALDAAGEPRSRGALPFALTDRPAPRGEEESGGHERRRTAGAHR